MPNKMSSAREVSALRSLERLLRQRDWQLEDYEHMVGFGYSAETQYAGGVCGSLRAGIVDARVMYKWSTGSRHIVKFETCADALAFWKRCTGLPALKPTAAVRFKRGSFARVIAEPSVHAGQVFSASPVGVRARVTETLTRVGSDRVVLDMSSSGIKMLHKGVEWCEVGSLTLEPSELEAA